MKIELSYSCFDENETALWTISCQDDGPATEVAPHRRVDTVRPSHDRDRPQPPLPENPAATLQAVSDYETAAYRFTHGLMRASVVAEARAHAMH